MKVMDARDLIYFRVSEEVLKVQEETIIPFWEKRSIRHKILENMSEDRKSVV